MGAALAVIAATVVGLGALGDVDLDAGVVAESRVRMLEEHPSAEQQVVPRDELIGTLRLAPHLALENDARVRLTLRYGPILTAPYDLAPSLRSGGNSSAPPEQGSILHSGDARARIEMGHWLLVAGVGATRGTFDPLINRTPADTAFVTTARLPYSAYEAMASVTSTSFRATTMSLTARTGVSGGRGADAEAVMPTLQELRLDGGVERMLSPRDGLGGVVSYLGTRVQRNNDALVLRGGGTWMRVLARPSILRMEAGLVYSQERSVAARDAGEDAFATISPWGRASYAYVAGERFPTLSAVVGSEPAIDHLRGTVESRGFLELTSGWVPVRDWRLGLTATGSWLEPRTSRVETHGRTWVGSLGGRIERAIGRTLIAGGGIASTWQRTEREDLMGFRELVVTLDLGATLPRNERPAPAGREARR